MTLDKTRVSVGIIIVLMLVAYVAGYALCRQQRLFIHTANVLNSDFQGRYHVIILAEGASPGVKMLGYVFWPLREVEAWCHCMGGVN